MGYKIFCQRNIYAKPTYLLKLSMFAEVGAFQEGLEGSSNIGK